MWKKYQREKRMELDTRNCNLNIQVRCEKQINLRAKTD